MYILKIWICKTIEPQQQEEEKNNQEEFGSFQKSYLHKITACISQISPDANQKSLKTKDCNIFCFYFCSFVETLGERSEAFENRQVCTRGLYALAIWYIQCGGNINVNWWVIQISRRWIISDYKDKTMYQAICTKSSDNKGFADETRISCYTPYRYLKTEMAEIYNFCQCLFILDDFEWNWSFLNSNP